MENNPFTIENLSRAARECMKSVAWKNSTAKWRRDLLHNCSVLADEIASGRYRQGKPSTFVITSPKKRTVTSMLFRDRVVHKVICHEGGLIEDLFRNAFFDNCACQKGKGTSFALERLTRHLRRHYLEHGADGYVLELDVRHFFDSIPHQQLVDFVYSKVRIPIVRKMVTDIIRGYPGEVGIGLGSEVSQVLANAYLTPVDFVCKMRLGVKHYVRYADNMVCIIPEKVDGFGADGEPKTISGKEYARLILGQVRYALGTLGLELNPKSSLHPLSQGISCLGFRYRLSDTGKVSRKVLKKSTARVRRRVAKMLRLVKDGRMEPEEVVKSVTSWGAYASQGTDSAKVRRIVDRAKEALMTCTSHQQKK